METKEADNKADPVNEKVEECLPKPITFDASLVMETKEADHKADPVNEKVEECLAKPITFDVVLEPRREENQENSDDDFDIIANTSSTMKYNETTKRVDLQYDVFIRKSPEKPQEKVTTPIKKIDKDLRIKELERQLEEMNTARLVIGKVVIMMM